MLKINCDQENDLPPTYKSKSIPRSKAAKRFMTFCLMWIR